MKAYWVVLVKPSRKRGEASNVARFHILEVDTNGPKFYEVESDPVVIGGVVECFRGRSRDIGTPAIYDAYTGRRVSFYEDTHEEALEIAVGWLAKVGLLKWRDSQMASIAKYGRPPEVIQIIQGPQEAGEIQTCSRETHCGHH